MNIVIQSSIHSLKKSNNLINSLTNDVLSNQSVSPYYSCIGSHIRHILDFYDCIIEGFPNRNIDLTNRKRDLKMHECCDYAIKNINRVISNLESMSEIGVDTMLIVSDDLGLGKTNITYTFGALLAQANSHAIHHYAIVSYILDRLNIAIEDENFGYNPTTPKPEVNLN